MPSQVSIVLIHRQDWSRLLKIVSIPAAIQVHQPDFFFRIFPTFLLRPHDLGLDPPLTAKDPRALLTASTFLSRAASRPRMSAMSFAIRSALLSSCTSSIGPLPAHAKSYRSRLHTHASWTDRCSAVLYRKRNRMAIKSFGKKGEEKSDRKLSLSGIHGIRYK